MSSFYGNGGYSSGGGEDPEEEATNRQMIGQLQSDIAVINTQVGALANGSPTPVATVAEMTDESAVYLYTGSESGYTAGNWYYYNGTAWTSGGTYGGAVTDTTLSISGAPADAKAVGDALAEKADADDVTALDTRVTAVEGDVRKIIRHEPTSVAENTYSVGDYFIYDLSNSFFRVTADIAVGDSIRSGVNVSNVSVDSIVDYIVSLINSGDSVTASKINQIAGQIIRHESTTTVTHSYDVGDYFWYDYTNTLYKVTIALNAGDTFIQRTNVEPVSASSITDAIASFASAEAEKVQTNLNRLSDNVENIPFIRPYVSADVTVKKYIKSDGSFATQNGWNITDYLPIKGIVKYSGLTTTSYNVYGAFYDDSENLISTFLPQKNENVLVPVDGAVYTRFSVANADLNTFSYVCQLTPSFDDVDAYTDIIAMPSDIYLYSGVQHNIYRDCLFALDDTPHNISASKGLNYSECWRYTPNASQTASITVTAERLDKKHETVLKTKSATAHFGSASHNAGTINCMFIGDSTTEQGRYLYPLLNNFGSDQTIINSVGTRDALNYSGIKCEGRSGWRLFDYVTYASLSSVTNAFWNPTSAAFDFSYYMSQNNIARPDYVFILLGINDIVKLGNVSISALKTSADAFVENLKTVVSSIKTYDSTINVVFGLITAPAKSQDAWRTAGPSGMHDRTTYKRNVVLFNSYIIDGLADYSDVYLIDTNTCIDIENNMETASEQVNSRNSMMVTRQNNLVHYPEMGGAQVADRIFSFVKCV